MLGSRLSLCVLQIEQIDFRQHRWALLVYNVSEASIPFAEGAQSTRMVGYIVLCQQVGQEWKGCYQATHH